MSLYMDILNNIVHLRMSFLFVMNQEKNSPPLSFKKITMLICSAIFLIAILFSFSSGDTYTVQANAGGNTENSDISILSAHDTDGDGLGDDLEAILGTVATDKYGDKDQDGLYDFEEYLDHYGTPDNTADTPKYNYNDSSTDGDTLDIYDKFGFDSNKSGYLRDTVFTERNGGFTNYLLWNVTFSGSYAGGSNSGSVNYINNALIDVTFGGSSLWYTGGSIFGSVNYINNTLINVTFAERYAGGGTYGIVSYMNNTLTNVTFSGYHAGGSWRGPVRYLNNTLTNVTFSGGYAGGSEDNTHLYENNRFINVRYNGKDSGISAFEHTNYTNNIFDRVQFVQLESRRAEYNMTLIGNSIVIDSYDSDGDGLGDIFEFMSGTEPEHSDSDGDGLSDRWEVKYTGSSGVDPTSAASELELNSDADADDLSLSEEEELGTDPGDSDTDDDGLNDGLEDTLKTNATNKYGDKDQDGLYDFEEYLDLYDTPDHTADTPKYNYNDSSTYGDILDIYHKFGFDSNKDGYLRDTIFTEQNRGFTNYLLWNVTFSSLFAGGSEWGSVSYINNTLTNVTFSGRFAGGSQWGVVSYINNTLTNVTFSNRYAGGSGGNTLLYENNTFINVRYIKTLYGGSAVGNSGISATGHTNYTNNIFDRVQFAQLEKGRDQYDMTLNGNSIITDSYDSDGDGLGDIFEFLNGMESEDSDSDGDGLNDAWEVKYNGSSGVNPLDAASDSELSSDIDMDSLSLSKEEEFGTDPEKGDTDRDGLNDAWEVKYNGSSGVNPLSDASDLELNSDTDGDDLSLSEEEEFGTDPEDGDTDDDGLNDAWEVKYHGSSGVNPLSTASDLELNSDADMDSLSLSEEEEFGTDPEDSDTDDDGLNDGWEVKYNGSSGVNPLSAASDSELNSDTDGDDLSLSEEEELGTDPGDSDTDDDGLNDGLEDTLETNATDKYGDKDQDGLYDFEEYLDLYDTPDHTADTPKYNYNDSSTYGDTLDIYHKFGFDSNKAGYLRDTVFTEQNGGFTNYLLWNVTFSGDYAGGSENGAVLYINNTLTDVSFSGDFVGGSFSGPVFYTNNTLTDVSFSGFYAGGSRIGSVTYTNNSLTDVTFSGYGAGGSFSGPVSYIDNSLTDVIFNGLHVGGSWREAVSYTNNTLTDVIFSGRHAGGSRRGVVSYMNNSLTNVIFSGNGAGGSEENIALYVNNSFINIRYLRSSNEGDSGVSATGHTNYTNNSFDRVQFAQLERGRAEYDMTFTGNNIITDSYDSDGDGVGDIFEFLNGMAPEHSDSDSDGLNDAWELKYNGSSGVNPLSAASDLELNSDVDLDSLSLSEEEDANTDPENGDTDSDGLNDSYEVEVGLNASNLDTDSDGLNDAWELKYNASSGVNPLSAASDSELNSDVDVDSLSLSEEEKLGTDPEDEDTDDDRLNDGLESELKTNATNKYGDKDQDGLYDFEEYLDLYGTPNNSVDIAKYNYNDSSTYEDILDIYHKFGLDSNKAGYLRDTVFTEDGGFTNYLFWNVTFSGGLAGGSVFDDVSYVNNILIDVTFSGLYAGGSSDGDVSYINNILIDVTFSGLFAGGSWTGSVIYKDNILTNVTFSYSYAGGSLEESVSYMNNTLTDVTFSGFRAGGSWTGAVRYINNTLTDVIFSGDTAGGSEWAAVSYMNNTLTNVTFNGDSAGGSEWGVVSYLDNTLTNVTFNGDSAGGSVENTVLYESNRFINVQYIKRLYAGIVVGDSGVSATTHTNYTNNIFDRVQFTQLEGRRDQYVMTLIGNTIITDSYDSDGDGVGDIFEFLNGMEPEHNDSDSDGLIDSWEVKYNGSSGVNPLSAASELNSDTDGDGLSLSEEEEFGTDPGNNDTDSDGLIDGWEAMYDESSGVDPLVNASPSELSFDADMDGLNLSEEEEANTDPEHEDTDRDGLNDSYEVEKGLNASNLDTDGDGLNDGWEMKYNGSSDADPLSVASASDLNSDTDADGLSLLEEEEHGTDPGESDTDSDELNDDWEVKYNGSSGVNPLVAASELDLNSDADKDGFILSKEEEFGTDPENRDTDSDGLSDSWEVKYNGSSGVDPLVPASKSDLNSDADGDGLSLSKEEDFRTDPEDNDTDGDGLNDGWEVRYAGSSGVNFLSIASKSELNSDADGDGLSLSKEEEYGTDPEARDTDKDGLNDAWEVKYYEYSGVDPLSVVFESDLKSDTDMDGLRLSEEEEHGTDPGDADMDGDGLNDGWEVEYAGSSGVDPLVAASLSDLNLDVDMDGLILSEEEEANTDPELANYADINTTSGSMTSSTSPNTQTEMVFVSEQSSESSSSFVLVVLIIVFIIVFVVFVILGITVFVVRVKKQIT